MLLNMPHFLHFVCLKKTVCYALLIGVIENQNKIQWSLNLFFVKIGKRSRCMKCLTRRCWQTKLLENLFAFPLSNHLLTTDAKHTLETPATFSALFSPHCVGINADPTPVLFIFYFFSSASHWKSSSAPEITRSALLTATSSSLDCFDCWTEEGKR